MLGDFGTFANKRFAKKIAEIYYIKALVAGFAKSRLFN